MTNLNGNELTILKAALDNAIDAAGGDFGFSDEIHGYVKDEFSKEQVAGYISKLNEKGLMWLDHCKTDTFDGNQTTFPRVTLLVMIKAGLIDEAYAEQFECWNYPDNNNGNVDDFDVPAATVTGFDPMPTEEAAKPEQSEYKNTVALEEMDSQKARLYVCIDGNDTCAYEGLSAAIIEAFNSWMAQGSTAVIPAKLIANTNVYR